MPGAVTNSDLTYVADHFVDRPSFQCPVRVGPEQRQQFLLARRFFAQPLRPIVLRQDDRHAVVQLRHALLAAEKQLWTASCENRLIS